MSHAGLCGLIGSESEVIIMEIGSKDKARYWVGVLYNENMREDWETDIGDILQLPYAYCIHDKDKQSDHAEDRKVHTHILIAFPNTTTYKNALRTFDQLSAPGKRAINTCEYCISVRGSYDYLIHDTETCKKKGKHLYDKSERKEGNNFDIGSFEQVSVAEKQEKRREISLLILEKEFSNYLDLYMYICSNYDSIYEEVLCNYSGHFERLTRGQYQKEYKKFREKEKAERSHLRQKLNKPRVKKGS